MVMEVVNTKIAKEKVLGAPSLGSVPLEASPVFFATWKMREETWGGASSSCVG